MSKNVISVKVIKGRHYGKRLYKAGKIYHVDQAEGEYLLAYKNTDGTPRFKRMVPRVAEPTEEKVTKRRPGRPKKSDTVKEVVDEVPVIDTDDTDGVDDMVEDSVEGNDFVEEEVEVVEEIETFDPDNEDNQEYIHEV